MPSCRDALIRLIRAQPVPGADQAEVLGVEVLGVDFAVRCGQSCNTILTGMGSHKPVDVLPDRASGMLAAWLREHPEDQAVCRDRARGLCQLSGIASGGRTLSGFTAISGLPVS